MNSRLTIQDIAVLLAEKTGRTEAEMGLFLKTFVTVVSEGVFTDRLVKVKGLGTFKIQLVEQRESIHVGTGERIVIPAHRKFTFMPDRELRETVNKPFSIFETTELSEGVDFNDIDQIQQPLEDEVLDVEEISDVKMPSEQENPESIISESLEIEETQEKTQDEEVVITETIEEEEEELTDLEESMDVLETEDVSIEPVEESESQEEVEALFEEPREEDADSQVEIESEEVITDLEETFEAEAEILHERAEISEKNIEEIEIKEEIEEQQECVEQESTSVPEETVLPEVVVENPIKQQSEVQLIPQEIKSSNELPKPRTISNVSKKKIHKKHRKHSGVLAYFLHRLLPILLALLLIIGIIAAVYFYNNRRRLVLFNWKSAEYAYIMPNFVHQLEKGNNNNILSYRKEIYESDSRHT